MRSALFNPRRYRIDVLAWPLMIFLAAFFLAPSSKSHNNFYYVFVLLPCLLLLRGEDVLLAARGPVWRLGVALIGYTLLSALWSDSLTTARFGKEVVHAVYVAAFLTLVVCMLERGTLRAAHLRDLLLLAAGVGVVVSLVGYFLAVRSGELAWPGARLRFFGRIDHEVIGAATYGLVAVWGYLASWRPVRWWRRLAYLTVATLAVAAVMTSHSRGPLLSIVGALLVAAGLERRWLLLAVLVIAIGAGAWYLRTSSEFGAYLYRGFSLRPEIWRAEWARFVDQPIFGGGVLDGTAVVLAHGVQIDHAHSIYLALLVYGGVVGLALLATLVLRAAKQGLVKLRESREADALTLLVYALFATATDSHHLVSSPDPVWLYFWLPVLLTTPRGRSAIEDRARGGRRQGRDRGASVSA